MIHIHTKQRYDLIRPAVKLERRGRRQLKTVCTAERRPPLISTEKAHFEKHVIAHRLLLNHTTVTCSCNNKNLINSAAHCLRMSSPSSQSVFKFFEDVNADSLQASSRFSVLAVNLFPLYFFFCSSVNPSPLETE